jgi:hypothetical protein
MWHLGTASTTGHGSAGLSSGERFAAALEYCGRREHLRQTIRIAIVVGLLLNAINEFDVILNGDADWLTWVKVGLNFIVPFVVSNLGLLSSRALR